MKRSIAVAIGVVALLGALSPPASAQAPAPKVTISGLIDTVTIGGKNILDGNFAAQADSTWHARNRGVFTITGEVGKAKGVVALEIDLGWGQVSGNESVNSNSGQTLSGSSSDLGTTQNAFQQGAMDLGVDVGGIIEVKNLYVDFPLPIPIASTVRAGAQPFQVTLKPAVLATTDYGGLFWTTTLAPPVKLNITYAQVEEQVSGMRASNAFTRGDDFFSVVALDVTPMKGWTIRPFWGYFSVQGTTAALARCRVQCAGTPGQGAGVNFSDFMNQLIVGTAFGATTGNYRTSSTEDRHYLGLDARLDFGPFFFDPTVIFMTSSVDVYGTAGASATTAGAFAGTPLPGVAIGQASGVRSDQDIESWLIDLRGGWRAGPLTLEGMFMWTPGDDAQHNSFRSSRLYHPVANDIGYNAAWSEILSLGSVDYFTSAGHGMGENIGLGRYGRIQLGGRASYAVTPAFSLNGKWATAWTDTKVDTDTIAGAAATGIASASYGAVPCALADANCRAGADKRGDERYIGSEFSAGFTYRFAPGLTFDMVGAYLFAGSALDTTFVNPQGGVVKQESNDAHLVAARLRYQF